MKRRLHSIMARLAAAVSVVTMVSCGNPPPLPTMADVQSKSPAPSAAASGKGVLATVAAGAFNQTAVKMIAWEYDDFFRTAQLDPAKERKVREILTQQQAGIIFAAGRFLLRAGDPTDEGKALDSVAATIAERDKQLAQILNPEELGRLKDYESPENVAGRLTPDRLGKLFPGLMNDKQGRAGQVMAEELKRDGANPVSILQSKEASRNLCSQIRARLGQEFSPDDMKGVEQGLGSLQESLKNAGH